MDFTSICFFSGFGEFVIVHEAVTNNIVTPNKKGANTNRKPVFLLMSCL
jgi:hypothetical protein